MAITVLSLYVVGFSWLAMGYGIVRARGPLVFGGFAMFWIGYACLGMVG